jgi:hypothetical protein
VKRRALSLLLALSVFPLVACGGGAASPPASATGVMVVPQNSSLTVGVDRVSIALLDAKRNPLSASDVTLDVLDPAGRTVERRQLTDVAAQYGGIPVYIGVARFPDVGQYQYVVSGRKGSATVSGRAFVTVSLRSQEVMVGAPAPRVSQPILGDAGVTLARIDSGVPPDAWHTATVAQGLEQHKPMVLFFGDPAYCPSKTCGPTRDILQQLCAQYCTQLLFEHIETYYPAQPPGPDAPVNPGFTAFGLQTDPWVYFANAAGIVSDRYEGPVTLSQLVESAKGTLAGAVPAVGLTT